MLERATIQFDFTKHILQYVKKLLDKAFSTVKTKTNPNFAVKLAQKSNHSFLLST